MKSGTFLGVAAVMGAMLANDAQAAQGERMRGAGATRVGAIRSMDGFRASEIRGFRGARTYSQPGFVSERRVITSRPVAYRSRGEFIRPSRRVVRSEFVHPVAYRRGVVMRERASQPRFVSERRVIRSRPVAYRTRGEFIRPARRVVRSEVVRPVAYRRGVVMRERTSRPRFVSERRVIRSRPVAYRTRGEFIRPARRVVRSEFVRPVAYRRGIMMRDRRLSSMRFADRDRFIVRRNVAFRDDWNRGDWRRADWRDRRGDWRRRNFRRAALVSSVSSPSYFYPSSYYYPTGYSSSFNYPVEYYTPSTYYTTVRTTPRYTYALAGTSTVLSVQTQLADLGYYEGPLDGLMGPMTRSAILRYERDRGLPGYGGINRTLLISLGLA